MYITTLGESDEEAAASAEASRRASRDLYAKYQSACKGIRILKHLTRDKLDPWDEELMLEKRIKGLPQLFQDLAALNRQARTLSSQEYERQYAALVAPLGYPPDIYLGRLDDALAQAKCELAWVKWRNVSTCDGMEVENPEHI